MWIIENTCDSEQDIKQSTLCALSLLRFVRLREADQEEMFVDAISWCQARQAACDSFEEYVAMVTWLQDCCECDGRYSQVITTNRRLPLARLFDSFCYFMASSRPRSREALDCLVSYLMKDNMVDNELYKTYLSNVN